MILYTLKRFGFRTDNLKESLIPYALLTLVLLAGLAVAVSVGGHGLKDEWLRLYGNGLYPMSVALVAFFAAIQEVFFRGFLVSFLKGVFNNAAAVVVLDAFLFGALHVPFLNAPVLVPEAFVAGLCFAGVYYYFPNVYAASIVHTVLNLCVFIFCGFGFASC